MVLIYFVQFITSDIFDLIHEQVPTHSIKLLLVLNGQVLKIFYN